MGFCTSHVDGAPFMRFLEGMGGMVLDATSRLRGDNGWVRVEAVLAGLSRNITLTTQAVRRLADQLAESDQEMHVVCARPPGESGLYHSAVEAQRCFQRNLVSFVPLSADAFIDQCPALELESSLHGPTIRALADELQPLATAAGVVFVGVAAYATVHFVRGVHQDLNGV